MTHDTKTGLYVLIEMARHIQEEMDTYKGCADVGELLENAIDQFKEAVEMLEIEHGEAFNEANLAG